MAGSPYNVKQRTPYQRNSKVYTVAGAIDLLQGGIAFLEGSSARAMTIAAPSTSDDGVVLHIVATTAQAHTVQFATVGFNGGGSGTDTATFGGAKGDGFTITARAGVWYTVDSPRNVTFG